MNKEKFLTILYGKEKWEVYEEFKKMENSIIDSNELYQYFDELIKSLHHEKSYIKVRTFRIICKLAKWDDQNKINNHLKDLLDVLNDDKPTNVRQCLASLKDLIQYKPELFNMIKESLKDFNYLKFKDTMSPLIKKDFDNLLGL